MRAKVIRISSDLLAEFLREGELTPARVKVGLPADAELVRIIPEWLPAEIRAAQIALVYQSSHWPEVENGEVIPVLDVVFERV